MRPTYRAIIGTVLAVIFVQFACTTDNPVSVDRPPVINAIAPNNGRPLSVFVGDTLTFSVAAMDPDHTALRHQYSVGDSIVSSESVWAYLVESPGRVLVECVVTDGVHNSRILWELEQNVPINSPPKILTYSPVERFPVMIVGNEMEFAIHSTDADNDPIQYYFTVDDSLVATTANFSYYADEIGEKNVTAVATDGEDFATRDWYLTVTGVPDTESPAEVQLLSVRTGAEPGEVVVEWLAVGEDGMDGVASNYFVRTSPSPITDEISWDRSSQRPNVPDPAPSGEVMEMVVTGKIPARYTYVAVRAVDDFGNFSPIGVSLGGYARGMRISGKVMDAVTGEAIPNVIVELAHFKTTTDSNGQFEFIELPPLNSVLWISDDGQVGVVGAYFDFRTSYFVVHGDYLTVYLIPDLALDTGYYPDFLSFYLLMTEIQGALFPNHQRRWELPIDIYVRPYEKDGLDYQATVQQVATDLGPHLNLEVFRVVDSEPEIGIKCIFRNGLMYDNFGVDSWSEDYYPLQGTGEFRTVYTPPTIVPFQTIIRHELGHGLGLRHSADPGHLMVGGMAPQVTNFTPDEVALIRAFYHIPRGVDMGSYSRE